MKIAPWPGPLFANVTLGVYLRRSLNEVALSCESVSPLSACSVIGTLWIDWLRRVAVTMIVFASSLLGAAAAAAASSAKAGVAATSAVAAVESRQARRSVAEMRVILETP